MQTTSKINGKNQIGLEEVMKKFKRFKNSIRKIKAGIVKRVKIVVIGQVLYGKIQKSRTTCKINNKYVCFN